MIPLATTNRHGLIAGTTGSGKTYTLLHLVTEWHRLKVPVLLVDCKGDMDRINRVVQSKSVTITIPIGEMPPGDVGQLLQATSAGCDALAMLWQTADDVGRALVTLEDVENGIRYLSAVGRCTVGTCNAVCRGIARLTGAGFDSLFRLPAFLADSLLLAPVSLVNASDAATRPEVYRALLSKLLGDLAQWPEQGDAPPRLVVCVDEAHLLFDNKNTASAMLIAMRLLRSRGVGVYYATQNPEDLPEKVLGLLGNKIVHSLRIFSPAALGRAKVLARELGVDYQTLATLPIGHACTAILGTNGVPMLWQGAITVTPELL